MSSITPHIEIARELVGKKHQRFSSIVHPDKSKATWDGPFCIPETRATVTSLLQDCNHSTSELDRLNEKLSGLKSEQEDSKSGYVSPFITRRIDQILEEIDDIKTGVIFKGKISVEVTPESYLQACELLMIEPGLTYAQGHKAYMRRLATCHPDIITRLALESMPEKPEKGIMGIFLINRDDSEEERWILQTKQALEADPLIPEPIMEEFTRRSRQFVMKHYGKIQNKVDDAVRGAMYKFEDDTPEYADYLQKTRDSFCQEHFEMDFRSVLLKKFSYSGESQNAYNIEKELPPNLKKGFTRFFNDLHEHERKTFRETSCAKHAFITTLSRYGILPDDLKTAEKRYEERLAHWEQVYGSKCRDIGETLSQNRDAVLHAWEVFQAYQGVAWEDAKGEIDIIWGFGRWGDSECEYKKIDLDRNDVMIASGFRRGVSYSGGLWYSPDYDWHNGHVGKKESLFAMVVGEMDKCDWPAGLHALVILLESPKLDEEKARLQAKKLREGSFQKPEAFDMLMKRIEEHPSIYSDAKEEILFEPTLIFGEGGTWPHALYEQSYELPLWFIFSHLYLNTTGNIPLRLGEKFLRKYLPDITVHEMSKILEQMSKKDNLEDYFGEEISSLQEEQRTIESNCQENGWNFFHATKYGQMAVVFNVFDKRSEAETEMGNNASGVIGPEEEVKQLQSRYETCENRISNILQLQQTIQAIYNGPQVMKQDDFGNWETPTRVGMEITPEGGIHLYFPLNEKHGREKIKVLYFSPKEAITMYLATLESPILDSRASMTRLLTNQPREENI